MSNSTNFNQMDLIWIESVLFTSLLWLKATIIKYFPNCLLMNLRDCWYSRKELFLCFFSFFFFLTTFAFSGLLSSSPLYFPTQWRINTPEWEKVLEFLFISSLLPYAQCISLLIFINAPLLSLLLTPPHYPSNRIMSFLCPVFLISLLSLP